ncbi:MAG TPA: response regulator [Roseiflexaceae bacterium]|nr:response regulator [Roseiflexaceae bacterium]
MRYNTVLRAFRHAWCYGVCTVAGDSMSQKKHITVVNDHPEFLALMSEFLTEEGYDVTAIPKHQGAFDQIKASQPDIVICDLVFDNMPAGWAVLDMLYLDPSTRSIPLILCSAATRQVQEASPSLAGKGVIWLEKPFELETLLALLEGIDDNPMAQLRTQRTSTTLDGKKDK